VIQELTKISLAKKLRRFGSRPARVDKNMASGNQYGYPAELETFDFYFEKMKLHLDPSTMQCKFMTVGLVDGSVIGGGASIFQPNQIKMENMLKIVRDNIALNGPKFFGLLIKALHSVPAYQNLANEMNSKSL